MSDDPNLLDLIAAQLATPHDRADGPDWTKVDSMKRRKWATDAGRVARLAIDSYPDAHTLDRWGQLAGIVTAPHRRPADLRAAGILVPTTMGHTLSGAPAMQYQANPELLKEHE